MLKFRKRVSLDHTVAAIAKYSAGVTWHGDSEGLVLILTAGGYALTARPEPGHLEMSHERVLIPKEDGSPMGDGHKLTQRERELAVRAILRGTLDRRTAAEPAGRSRRGLEYKIGPK